MLGTRGECMHSKAAAQASINKNHSGIVSSVLLIGMRQNIINKTIGADKEHMREKVP
jgi:hypothetical protein